MPDSMKKDWAQSDQCELRKNKQKKTLLFWQLPIFCHIFWRFLHTGWSDWTQTFSIKSLTPLTQKLHFRYSIVIEHQIKLFKDYEKITKLKHSPLRFTDSSFWQTIFERQNIENNSFLKKKLIGKVSPAELGLGLGLSLAIMMEMWIIVTNSAPVDLLMLINCEAAACAKISFRFIEFIFPLNLEALQNVKPITMLQDLIIFCLPEVIELPGFCWDWFNPLTCRLLDRLYIPGRRGGANWLSSTT